MHQTVNDLSDTERRIFDAAIEVFGEAGRRGARMQDIADRAGFNKALVHYYFRSKDRLYEAVLEYIFRTTFTMIGQSLCGADDFKSMLKTFIDRYLDLIEKNPVIFRFMVREITSGAPVLRQAAHRLAEDKQSFPPRLFIEKCRTASERGEIRAVDPVQTLITVFGACVYHQFAMPLVSILQPGVEAHRAAFIRKRKLELFDLLYYGLKPRSDEA
jgi:TetR/AcrR family transcriptional regulator